ncbi:MAG: hypothetical protein KC978_01195, partial [Candidatus Omnitrophica bacterium]|nr:hypothetical protein [Candidatus Omnitrophota bacterium]
YDPIRIVPGRVILKLFFPRPKASITHPNEVLPIPPHHTLNPLKSQDLMPFNWPLIGAVFTAKIGLIRSLSFTGFRGMAPPSNLDHYERILGRFSEFIVSDPPDYSQVIHISIPVG